MANERNENMRSHTLCHCCGDPEPAEETGLARRDFLTLGSVALGGLAMAGMSWQALAADGSDEAAAPPRDAINVKPILMYDLPKRRPQSSWRNWGDIQTQEHADQEAAKIAKELESIRKSADFPVNFLPVAMVRSADQIAAIDDLAKADAVIAYGAGGPQKIFDAVLATGKPMIIFLRHKSGPVSLWYEIVSPRFLHQHTDFLSTKGVDNSDVVVDSLDELSWRLRTLCGLKNTIGAKILAIGGAGGWATPKAPELAQAKFKFDIQPVTYPDLGKLIQEARADEKAVAQAKSRAAKYLADSTVKLETEKSFVENAFLLEQVFRALMQKAGARMMTINHCMGTVMPLAETSACLSLSLLNDAGYLAFCESDFVVIPSGVLLAGISGKPQFLNDPTYPHAGVITLAHCTAPRRNDGKTLDPVRILTHFESDYGAAPKVEMKKDVKVTNIIPDFKAERWTGFVGRIVENPFLAICRSQIDVGYDFPDARLAENMPGFHWMTCYGDYSREIAYAAKKIPVGWVDLGSV